jgi:GNAT superfamily N-acetyltransferase
MAIPEGMALPRLRRARPADAVGAADVWLRSRRASLGAIPPVDRTDDEVRQWIVDRVFPSREVWVVETPAGRVVGFMVLARDWLEQLYIDPDWTGQGLGSRLVALAKALRPNGLQLRTFKTNSGARRFYERHGFQLAQRTDAADEAQAPDIEYRWTAHTSSWRLQ